MSLRWSSWRARLMLLSLVVMCLWLLHWTILNTTVPFVSRATWTHMETRPRGRHGCQYGLVLAINKPPAPLRRAWNFRTGDALNDFGLWAYHDSYAMYVRLGMFTLAPRCVSLPR